MALKIHKLTKKDAQKICDNFNLGKAISIKLFSDGLINSNYRVETNKDTFVVRFLGHEFNEYKRNLLNLERRVLFHLKEKNFPYEIPVPLPNKNKKYLSKLNGRYYWVYRMIKGKSVRKLNENQLKEVGKAAALYYKFVKNLKIKINKGDFTMDYFIDRYKDIEKKLSKIKNLDRTDKLVKENLEFFKDLVHRLDKIDFKTNMIAVHGDIHAPNLLFKGDKLVGIIDFDNIRIAPRIEDVSCTLRLSALTKTSFEKKRANMFIKEYEKQVKLTKKEKNFIIPLMIRTNSIVFWWMYMEMAKGQDKKYWMMKWTVDVTKALAKEWE